MFRIKARGLIVCALLALCTPNLSHAVASTKPGQILAMETILTELETHYGMLEFKESEFGITLEGLREKYGRLINEARTLEEDTGLEAAQTREALTPDQFQQLMVAMIAELKDGHVNLTRLSYDYYTLGIYTAAIEGRLFVTGFAKDIFIPGRAAKPVQIGDEIIAADGVSIQDLADRLRPYAQTGTYEARNNFALQGIVNRPRAVFPAVKEGTPITLAFRRGDQTFEGDYNWIETRAYRNARELAPESFDSHLLKAWTTDVPVPFGFPGTVHSYFRTGLDHLGLPVGSEYDIGALLNQSLSNPQQSEIRPVQRLRASVVRVNGKNVGILRVPSYSPGSPAAAINELKWIAELLKRFENAVDVLVIDQLSNSGGYVFYVGGLGALLAGQEPLKSFTVNMRLNETVLNRYADPSVSPDPMTGRRDNWAQNHLRQLHYENLLAKFKAGEKWSGPLAMFHPDTSEADVEVGKIMPSDAVSFTKPILILNDNKSASGGDFFPALMQSNGRAVVMGESSSGLGGPVFRGVDSMSGSEMSFRCTIGYCQRPDGLPMEDLGAVPNLVRPIRAGDLQDGFRHYGQDVLNTAVALADGHPLNEIQESFRAGIDATPRGQEAARTVDMLRKNLDKLRATPVFVTAETDLSKALDQGLAAAYAELFSILRKAEEQVPGPEFRGLVIPLPKSFIASDRFLGSLWRRGEFTSRLNEMLKLPRYQEDARLNEFVRVLRDGLAGLHADIWTAHPCELMLSGR
jgi:C-terminal processing protease CtpA/Prc